MPLDKRCSTDAFKSNVRAEIDAGKDPKQAVAIAYSVMSKACGCPKGSRMTPKQMAACGQRRESSMETHKSPNWDRYGMRDPAFSYPDWALTPKQLDERPVGEGKSFEPRAYDIEAQKMKKRGYTYKIRVELSNRMDYLYAKTASHARKVSLDYPGSVIMPIDKPHSEGLEDSLSAPIDEKCGKKKKSFLVRKECEGDLEEAYHVDSATMLGAMKQAVTDLLTARTGIRKVHENLGKIRRDATGVVWTDNYGSKEIEKVEKGLYELDFTIGRQYQAIESLIPKLRDMIVKAKR